MLAGLMQASQSIETRRQETEIAKAMQTASIFQTAGGVGYVTRTREEFVTLLSEVAEARLKSQEALLTPLQRQIESVQDPMQKGAVIAKLDAAKNALQKLRSARDEAEGKKATLLTALGTGLNEYNSASRSADRERAAGKLQQAHGDLIEELEKLRSAHTDFSSALNALTQALKPSA